MTKLKITAHIELYNGNKFSITNNVKSRQVFVKSLNQTFPRIKSLKLSNK